MPRAANKAMTPPASHQPESPGAQGATPSAGAPSITEAASGSPKRRRKVNHGKSTSSTIEVPALRCLYILSPFGEQQPSAILASSSILPPALCCCVIVGVVVVVVAVVTVTVTAVAIVAPTCAVHCIAIALWMSCALTDPFPRITPAYDLRLGGRVQERPCTRCVKRDIGHLCHDEPRDPAKKPKGDCDNSTAEGEATSPTQPESSPRRPKSAPFEARTDQTRPLGVDPQMAPTSAPQGGAEITANTTQAQTTSGTQGKVQHNNGIQQYPDYSNWPIASANQFQDMHNFYPSYMFNAPEVTNEYKLLNDFLSTSLQDDGAFFSGDDSQTLYPNTSSSAIGTLPPHVNSLTSSSSTSSSSATAVAPYSAPVPPGQTAATSQASIMQAGAIARPPSTMPNDKARETFYRTAADPAGENDSPEDRMNALLQAKYDAGLLKPFNYLKGYARLSHYMEKNMQPSSRQKILRQLDKFRPMFRERMQRLTDMELVRVEMWFERSLLEYDRVFASMAIPACCWRRTGEIFRGNKEMAELIHVPIEKLRDGKVAIHEIIEEESIVSYWEKFGTIAFDAAQKAMLTSCFLKNPDPGSKEPNIHCCFSFTIRRDSQGIPTLRDKLLARIQDIVSLRAGLAAADYDDLDRRATSLWNFAVRLTRSDRKADGSILVPLRVFAFLLLDYANHPAQSSVANTIRLLKVSLGTANSCLEHHDHELCLRVLKKAAQAWRQKREDLAEHFFSKASLGSRCLDPVLAQSLSDPLFEIGKEMLAAQKYDMSVRWLERALDALTRQVHRDLSREAGELRQSIMHALVRAHLGIKTELADANARDLVTLMERDYGDKLFVLTLKLETLEACNCLDPASYHGG
ncbi:MAG: hypothetical protein M1825_001129 [Sarcosagium campestre]|nr:MAG: hypothetical protein M1825_001129 [Sarcosagium campestre]